MKYFEIINPEFKAVGAALLTEIRAASNYNMTLMDSLCPFEIDGYKVYSHPFALNAFVSGAMPADEGVYETPPKGFKQNKGKPKCLVFDRKTKIGRELQYKLDSDQKGVSTYDIYKQFNLPDVSASYLPGVYGADNKTRVFLRLDENYNETHLSPELYKEVLKSEVVRAINEE